MTDAAQMSISEVLSGPKAMPGEDLLKSGPKDMNDASELPAEPVKEPVKKGDKKKEAAPASKEEQTAKAPDDADDAPEEVEDPHPVPRKALIAERKKRQELERRLAQMEGQVSVYQSSQQAQKAPQEPPRPEDQFYRDPVAFVDQRLAQQRLQISEELVRSQHPDDYQEKVDAFAEAVKHSPHLLGQFRSHNNPAQFAYETGKAFSELKDVGSLDDYRAKLRSEIEAEVEARLRKEGALAAASNATTSAASARGTGGQQTTEFAGPTNLKKLFPGLGI